MKPLHLIDCSLVVYMHREGSISTRQFQVFAREFGISIARVQKAMDALVSARLVRMLTLRGADA